MPGLSATTRVFALLGDPVEHSLSPALQNRAFEVGGVDGVYVALRTSAADLPGLLRGISWAGGGGNVTLPHKEQAVEVLDHASEAVRRTGACNTFWHGESGVHGDNTDVAGFGRALTSIIGAAPTDLRVLLLGAGGAARAALVSLLDGGVRQVDVLNRTTQRARAMARRVGDHRVRVVDAAGDVAGSDFDLVVNATRLGLAPEDPLPFDLDRLERAGAVVDLVYGEEPTPFVRAAEAHGVPAADGLEMLLQQGAVAFERWWGLPAPIDEMRAAMGEARVG